ncbi:MAG: ribosome biogenesis GTP-binding protein YihA/YsxC [Bacilli bacterium]
MFEKCEFITSSVDKDSFPNTDNLPEFVFIGRSNVGKSSLVNAITKRQLLAYVSSKPGKTQTINFFKIDDKFYLVDVPGYGYANASKSDLEKFGKYIESYLTNSPNIKIVFLLVDTKVGPTKDDLLMLDYLRFLHLKIVILGTKLDKIRTTFQMGSEKNIQKKVGVNDIIMTSAKQNKGIEKIENKLKQYLG